MSMASERASVTVLTHALALFFLSNFFLIFFMGVLLLLLLFESRGMKISVTPGYSPAFQCFCLGKVTVDDDGRVAVGVEEEQQNMASLGRRRVAAPPVVVGRGEKRREEEKDRRNDDVAMFCYN